MPPMNIKVRDNRSFGRKPVVGLCSLKSLHRYRREPRDHIDGQDVQGKFDVARCVIHFLSSSAVYQTVFQVLHSQRNVDHTSWKSRRRKRKRFCIKHQQHCEKCSVIDCILVGNLFKLNLS